jgi:hypothetical protein
MLKQNEQPFIISGKRVKVLFFIFSIFLLTIAPMYAQQFVNGDFEMGDFTGWTVTGPHSANVVQHQGSYCGHIHINPGSASGQSTMQTQLELILFFIELLVVMELLNTIHGNSIRLILNPGQVKRQPSISQGII